MQRSPGPGANPPIYVSARALVSPELPLTSALRVARAAGADGFEFCQELLPLAMNPGELKLLPELLAAFRAPPVLSVPKPLFQNNQLQRDLLGPALLQSRSFGCALVAFPLGDIRHVDDAMLHSLGEYLTTIGERAPRVRITVENGQTPSETHLARWNTFLEQAAAWPRPVGMTFDLGNWTCTGEDAVEAAQQLGRFVEYIHVRGATFQDGHCVALPIRPSDTVFPVLRQLPPEAPRGLTIVPGAPDRAMMETALGESIALLRSGRFTV